MSSEKRNCNQICHWNDPIDGCVRPKGRVCPLSNTEPDASGWGQVQENKKRLIDSNKLESAFKNAFFGCKTSTIKKIWETAIKAVRLMPTVDAVEVVRCKDCKHYKPRNQSAHWKQAALCCTRTAWINFPPDGFCSYGERKDNERKVD